jgi:hypothetical protein
VITRDKLILAGLYLSKFDAAGLQRLGFESFMEAFNVIGYALGGKPARIKNYRDEFDPLFANTRRGWHKRPRRAYCMELLSKYDGLALDEFASLIRSFIGMDARVGELFPEESEGLSAFASRVATGIAAERYFQTVLPDLPEFRGYSLEDTTQLGCGYDFRLSAPSTDEFLAVEVKGLGGHAGSLSLTPKEHSAATLLCERFFLFVVKNFRESPCHQIYRSPLEGPLRFRKTEQRIVQVSWLASVG